MHGNLIDLTRQKFGRLIIIKRNYPNKWGHPMWLCKCECGTEKVIAGNDLRSGNTKSCGCLRRERTRLILGLANMRALICGYKQKAKIKELDYKLNEEQFEELTQKNCHYCGANPNNISKDKGRYGSYTYSGLDRIDNSKGYTIDNVVPCCKQCNTAKKNFTLQEFKDWIKKVYDKLGDLADD